MITALIVDDEENNRTVLEILIKKHCPMISLIGKAASADEAVEMINRLQPKLLLLDVKMKSKTGFDLLRMFDKIDFEVVFVTAHDNFAVTAFEFNAVGYVLKPVDVDKLKIAVDKAIERIKSKRDVDVVMHFINTLSEKNELVNKFSVHHNGKVVFISVSEISFIQTSGNNTILNMIDNAHYYSSKDLARFEEVLRVRDNFLRINKSVIINIDHLKSYSKGETCYLEMKSGQSFEVSRRRKTDIIKKLKPY
jgi:two-component system LytT family response regulator